jgi:hypothetical protein
MKSTYRLTFNDTLAPSITIEATGPRNAAYKYAQTQGSLGMLNYIKRCRPYHHKLWEIMGTSGRVIYAVITKES